MDSIVSTHSSFSVFFSAELGCSHSSLSAIHGLATGPAGWQRTVSRAPDTLAPDTLEH
jgi:hypothetical protein